MEEEVLFDDQYEVCEIIHCGAFSQSHRCIRRDGNVQRIVRIIDVARFTLSPGLSVQELKREASIWSQLRHPHIVELVETYTSEGQLYMVSEFMDGSDICYEVVKRATAGFVYSEAVASHYMRQVLEAVSYLHSQGVVHRALRPESIIMLSKENSSPVKVTGMRSADHVPPTGALPHTTPGGWGPMALAYLHMDDAGRVGHGPYMAPEVIRGEGTGQPSDCWALGCILHLLLSGELPFSGSGDFLRNCIANSEVQLSSSQWRHVTDEAQQLVLSLLNVDPSKRMSASEALQHVWIRDKTRAPRTHLSSTVEQLKLANSRRQVESLVRNTYHSPLWLSGYQRSLWEQDWPGVDQGVQYVLNALQDVCLIQGASWQRPEYSQQSQLLTSDRFFRYWLALFDRINVSNVRSLGVAGLASPSAKTVLEDLSVPNKPLSPAASELREILAEPNLAALLQVHDVLALEVYSSENTPTVSGPGAGAGSTPDDSVSASVNGHEQAEEAEVDIGMEKVNRVRVVQFQKNPQEPMGITLKVNEDAKCVVARIMHGGMIHRQGTLHVGDEIREINGNPVDGVSVEGLQKMLASLEGSVHMKIIPAQLSNDIKETGSPSMSTKQMFVRALFNYSPRDDDLIPCAQAGVQFQVGDILQIISKEDGSWWQARRLQASASEPAGLVPSPELQEWRAACQAMEQAKHEHAANCSWFGRGKKKQSKDKYLAKHNAVFDQLDVVTYEEVVQLPAFRRRTLVLLGAHGVGRRHIKNTLITSHPDRFAYPIPHTTRPPKPDEQNGKNYYFVKNEQMMRDIAANEYLEYGTHENYMYGTKLETVRQIHDRGLMAILDVEPQALKVLRTGDFAPYVVFIAAPSLHELQSARAAASNQDSSLERLAHESQLLDHHYGHYFDLKITNNDIENTIQRLERAIDAVCQSQQWVPVSWIY